MSDVTSLAPTATPVALPQLSPLPQISVRGVLPWLIFAGLLFLMTWYFIGAEEGATTLIRGNAVHEWVHDSRHLLGFPCH